jgi:pentatricopeptide repeat protein
VFTSLRQGRGEPRPNAVTYNTLMGGHLSKDRPQAVRQLWQDMQAAGVPPSLVTFNNVVAAHCRLGAWLEASSMLTHMARWVGRCQGVAVRSCV